MDLKAGRKVVDGRDITSIEFPSERSRLILGRQLM